MLVLLKTCVSHFISVLNTMVRYKYFAKSVSNNENFQTLYSFGSKLIQETGFLDNAFYNGFGRYVNQLQRLTIKFCKHNTPSKGVRDFIQDSIVDFSKNNPGVVVYLKPRRRKTPVMVCEYLNGSYHWMSLYNFTKEEMTAWISYFTTRSGESIKFFEKDIRTFWPSVQGPWNPFLNKPTNLNLIDLPSEERGRFLNKKLSATEQLLRMEKDGSLKNLIFDDEDHKYEENEEMVKKEDKSVNS